MEDYENFSVEQAVKPPNPLNDDTAETSEDDMELFYTQVDFVAKPSLPGNSRTFDGEETEYSGVQF